MPSECLDIYGECTAVAAIELLNLTSVALRTGSEHTIDGKQFPLEVQLLHKGERRSLTLSVLFEVPHPVGASGARCIRPLYTTRHSAERDRWCTPFRRTVDGK